MHHQQPNDMPAPRTIRIGKANIGLIGLDAALARALQAGLPPDEAADQLLVEVGLNNYIPDSARALYREALHAEYRRRLGQEVAMEEGRLAVRVLGSGCVTCNQLSAMVFTALAKLGLAADMESVHDLDEIWRFGVTKTPAMIINRRVKCAGRMPTQAEVEAWLAEEAAATDKDGDTPS
ncbi:MAG: thioredoxin family protein [Thermodesulfobacteriota bacterium]